MRGLVVVAVLLLVSVVITTLLYIAKDTNPSVTDNATVDAPARSARRKGHQPCGMSFAEDKILDKKRESSGSRGIPAPALKCGACGAEPNTRCGLKSAPCSCNAVVVSHTPSSPVLQHGGAHGTRLPFRFTSRAVSFVTDTPQSLICGLHTQPDVFFV